MTKPLSATSDKHLVEIMQGLLTNTHKSIDTTNHGCITHTDHCPWSMEDGSLVNLRQNMYCECLLCLFGTVMMLTGRLAKMNAGDVDKAPAGTYHMKLFLYSKVKEKIVYTIFS